MFITFFEMQLSLKWSKLKFQQFRDNCFICRFHMFAKFLLILFVIKHISVGWFVQLRLQWKWKWKWNFVFFSGEILCAIMSIHTFTAHSLNKCGIVGKRKSMFMFIRCVLYNAWPAHQRMCLSHSIYCKKLAIVFMLWPKLCNKFSFISRFPAVCIRFSASVWVRPASDSFIYARKRRKNAQINAFADHFSYSNAIFVDKN